VLPLGTGRVLRVAVRDQVQAVGRLAGNASDRLLGQDLAAAAPRSDARAVDAAYQATSNWPAPPSVNRWTWSPLSSPVPGTRSAPG
jgi:hypothetical protein